MPDGATLEGTVLPEEYKGFFEQWLANWNPKTVRGGAAMGLSGLGPLGLLGAILTTLPYGRMNLGGLGGDGMSKDDVLRNLLFDQANRDLTYGPGSVFAEGGRSTGWTAPPGRSTALPMVPGYHPGFELDRPSLKDLLFEHGRSPGHSPRKSIMR